MALPEQFLEEIKARVSVSSVVGASIKLVKAGREMKACCPFHSEKTPSFSVVDDKGFYHCHGCGAHGDVFRWLTDHQGLPFMDAVRELAGRAGMEMPAPSPEYAARAERVETVRGALEAAQAIYVRQLGQTGAVMEYLAARGLGPDAIETFGIGYARGQDGSLKGSGIGQGLGKDAGLLTERDAIGGGVVLGETFWDRVTVPIHDARGRLCGYAGRVWPGRKSDKPKFLNSPDGPLFDKGSLLFNQHRAAELLRAARPAVLPLVVVEGHFDVVAMHGAGFAAVAPMGTALTDRQLEKLWRMHHRPVLMFDGDAPGQAAALRAAKVALPLVGPGRELRIAVLPAGCDPDDILRGSASPDGSATAGVRGEGGDREIEACLLEARALYGFVFDAISAALPADAGPEQVAGMWAELSELAGTIRDGEVRAQYLGLWRARFERECSSVPSAVPATHFHAITRSDDGDYVFPESANDSEARLIAIVRRALRLREERKAITEDLTDLLKMAESIGFVKKEITAVVRDIESDLAHGAGVREESEMTRVLYRRTLGLRGPMNEAMLPQVVDARARPASATIKRRAAQTALLEAGGLGIA